MNGISYLNAMASLYDAVKNGSEEKEKLQELIYFLEGEFNRMSAQDGYNPNQQDKMIQHYDESRKKELASLEEKAKNKNSVSFVQEQAKNLSSRIKEFWKETGFHYVDKIKFENNGTADITFGFSLDYGAAFSNKKATGKKEAISAKQSLILQGFQLDEKMQNVLDTDGNKEKIKNMIIRRFPSVYVKSWETFMCGKELQKLYRLNVRIRDLKEI